MTKPQKPEPMMVDSFLSAEFGEDDEIALTDGTKYYFQLGPNLTRRLARWLERAADWKEGQG